MAIRWIRISRHLSTAAVEHKPQVYLVSLVIFVSAMLLHVLILPPLAGAQGPLTEPEDVKQVEHPSNTPVAELFNGSYVDSTDDPGTGVSVRNANNVDITIGEEFNFIITYTFPEGTTNNFIAIDVTTPNSGVLPGGWRNRVIELLSAEVIHVGDNLGGADPVAQSPGLRPEGYSFGLNDVYVDGDNDRIQLTGTGSRNVVNTSDGVINDGDRYVIRIRARLDDEDNAGGAADSDNGGPRENRNGRIAANRLQTQWTDSGGTQNTRNIYANIDIVEPAVDVTKTTITGTGLQTGETATFELNISNTGTAPAYNIGVTDTLPNSGAVDYVVFAAVDGANSTCDDRSGFAINSGAAPDVAFSFDDLDAGANCTIRFNTTVQATISPGATYTNTATVTTFDSRDNASNADNRTYSGGSDTSIISMAAPDLQLSKVGNSSEVLPGETISYTLAFTNVGGLPVNNVVLTETVPANTTFNAGASSAGWSCADGSPAGTVCTQSIGTLAANGGNGQVDFAVDIDTPLGVSVSQIANSATIGDDGSNGGDLNPSDNSASATTPVINSGNLTIIKAATPADGTDFAFTSTVPGNTSFTLDDEISQTDAISQSITFADLSVGTYAVTEALPNDWQLDSASCIGGSDNGNLRGETLFIALEAGENITCTFTNSVQTGSLTIIEIATPADGTDFQFSGDLGTFTLDDARADDGDAFTNMLTFADLVVGTYAITESLPAGWQLDSATCTGTSGRVSLDGETLSVEVAANETVQCTFTNSVQTGSLTIVTAATPEDGTDFAFTSTVPGHASFSLDVDDDSTLADRLIIPDLVAGTYTITETLPADWQLDSASCTGGSDSGSLNGETLSVALGAGEDVICTFTNRRTPNPTPDGNSIYLPLIVNVAPGGSDLVVGEIVQELDEAARPRILQSSRRNAKPY